MSKITIIEDGFEYKATIIQTSGVTETGNCRIYWQGEPKEIDMSQYIPIEWIKWYMQTGGNEYIVIRTMLDWWEKENGRSE